MTTGAPRRSTTSSGHSSLTAPDARRLAAAIGSRLPKSPRYPITHLDFLVTTDCNHECDYCFYGRQTPQTMTTDVIERSVAFLVRESGPQAELGLLLFGGEPLCAWDESCHTVERCIAWGTQTGKRISLDMTTNGSLLTEERARWLARNGVKYLLSLDGLRPTHDAHRKRRDGASSFDSSAPLLPMLKRYQPWQGTRITVHPDQGGLLPDNVRGLHELGINQFLIGAATGLHWEDDQLEAYAAGLRAVARFVRERREQGGHIRWTMLEDDPTRPLGYAKGHWGCGAGRSRACISPEGEIHGCARLLAVPAARERYRLGDVWSGITRRDARAELASEDTSRRVECATCELADDCMGGCPATNMESTGGIFGPDPLGCWCARNSASLRRELGVR